MKEHPKYKEWLSLVLCLIKNKFSGLIFFFILSTLTFSQTDWARWEKADISYQLPMTDSERDYDFEISTASDLIIKPVINTYWFFVSDLDGANCPFHPSCSEFFVESVEQTNLVQGTIMFFDRFTRDTNIFDKHNHYPFYDAQHYYDPAIQYTFQKDSIRIYPVKAMVSK